MKKTKPTKAYIQSHEDYEYINLTNEESLNQLLSDYKEDGDNWEPEYITDIDEGKFQMIYWHDEGPDSMSFDSKKSSIPPRSNLPFISGTPLSSSFVLAPRTIHT